VATSRYGPIPPPSLRRTWEEQSWTLRILRAFLGVTFVYAGIQKFMDRSFLHSGTPGYIGDQLRAFAQGSPIGPVMSALAHVAPPAGIGIALLEIAVGLGTLLAIAPITSAAIGLAINLVLFLSATWHVHPYFLGSDSIYAVAWGAYLAGLVVARRAEVEHAVPLPPRRRAIVEQEIARRRFLRGATLVAGSFLLGIAGSLLQGKSTETSALGGSTPGSTTEPRHTSKPGKTGSQGGSQPSTEPPSSAPAGTPIVRLDSVPVGGAVPFHDPSQGPAVLCRLGTDKVAAYSRVCTHAGCLVDFDQQSGVLFCPCHGAEFDPRHGAQVIGGPAPAPLPAIPVTIDRSTGEVLATK
jgi:thiosulfate dehydrogenase [quinone] large subunit